MVYGSSRVFVAKEQKFEAESYLRGKSEFPLS